MQGDSQNLLKRSPGSARVGDAHTHNMNKCFTKQPSAISLRALPEQRELIDRAASLLGKSRADFVLEAACEQAQEVVLNQVAFCLNDKEFKSFTDLLDAPLQPNPGLERLLSLKAPWKVSAA